MSKFASTIKHEFAEVVPPTVYFFVILHIVALIRVLMIRGTGIPAATTMSITVAALILGKAVLIADALPFINRFPREGADLECPVEDACSMSWWRRSFTIWSICTTSGRRRPDSLPPMKNCFQDRLAAFLGHPDPAFDADLHVLRGGELARVVGRDKLKAMFFGPLPGNPTSN